MVATQLRGRDIVDEHVLEAMAEVPRHRFVPEELRELAYRDQPLPIGHGQTISQPYIVALMIQLAGVRPGHRVLDIGTGCGYQAAVLAHMGAEVWSLEIVEPLAHQAAATLAALGYRRVQVRCADATGGWPEEAPFDAILGAAAPAEIPQALLDQLRVGGRLIMPEGRDAQMLVSVERTETGFRRRDWGPVAFVPMTRAPQRP